MLLLTLTAVTLLSTTYAFTKDQANNYIDHVLSEKYSAVKQQFVLDPHILPDLKVDTLYDGPAEILIKIMSGSLKNLSTVHRAGDCSEPLSSSSSLSFSCDLQFKKLRVDYTIVILRNKRLVGITHLTIYIDDDTTIRIQVTTSKEENEPNLTMYEVSDIGHMFLVANMRDNFGDLTQFVAKPIRDTAVENSKANLKEIMNAAFKDALSYSISKTPVSFLER